MFDQGSHLVGLLAESRAEREAISFGQRIATLVQRDAEPEYRGQRAPQLVRSERDELAVQRIEPLCLLASESALPATVDGAPSLERATARLGHPIRIAAGAALLALRGVRWHLGGGAARRSSGVRAAAREAAIAR